MYIYVSENVLTLIGPVMNAGSQSAKSVLHFHGRSFLTSLHISYQQHAVFCYPKRYQSVKKEDNNQELTNFKT